MNGSAATRALGISAGLEAGLTRDLAALCRELGYHSLWSNDETGVSGLETLSHFAVGAPGVELGVGVLPLDRHPPERIAAEVERLGLDPAKLWLGVGAGSLRPQLDVVRRSVDRLRELVPAGTRIVVAAMRPRLCRLGGAIAEGVLLNWMVPAHAAEARGWVDDGAREAGRDRPLVASYVRVAVGEGAAERLSEAEGSYRTISDAYRRHFESMGAPAGTVGVAAASRPEVLERLEPYRSALDLTIVRVLAARDADALAAVARAAAP